MGRSFRGSQGNYVCATTFGKHENFQSSQLLFELIMLVPFSSVIVQSQNWGWGDGRGAMKPLEIWQQLVQIGYPK
jgi:hypothetical protein